jgi:hypothetical protein
MRILLFGFSVLFGLATVLSIDCRRFGSNVL